MEYHDTPLYRGNALRKKRNAGFIAFITAVIIAAMLGMYWIDQQIDRPLHKNSQGLVWLV